MGNVKKCHCDGEARLRYGGAWFVQCQKCFQIGFVVDHDIDSEEEQYRASGYALELWNTFGPQSDPSSPKVLRDILQKAADDYKGNFIFDPQNFEQAKETGLSDKHLIVALKKDIEWIRSHVEEMSTDVEMQYFSFYSDIRDSCEEPTLVNELP